MNLLHQIYTDFDDPVEGLQRVTAMLEFLVEINERGVTKDFSVTSKEGAIVIIELIRKILDVLNENLSKRI